MRDRQREDLSLNMGKLRASVKKATGLDPHEVPWKLGDRVHIKRLEEKVNAAQSTMSSLLEAATSYTGFSQLLRYGVQNYMFDAYLMVPTIYEDMVSPRPSKTSVEFYAPMYNPEVPMDAEVGDPLEDSRLVALDVAVRNKWVGRILSIDRQLVDDDQTGQIIQKAGSFGKMMKYKEELDVIIEQRSGGSQGYSVAIGNRPATFGQLSQANLEAADIALSSMKDQLGNFLFVIPDLLTTGTGNKFTGAKLLNSSLQPSVPGVAGVENIAVAPGVASGGTGWTMTINPLQGLYKFKYSRFYKTTEWYLQQSKTGLVFQDRLPLETSQELPLSGDSFMKLIYRWRCLRRYQVKMIESRFTFQGNDGSV